MQVIKYEISVDQIKSKLYTLDQIHNERHLEWISVFLFVGWLLSLLTCMVV